MRPLFRRQSGGADDEAATTEELEADAQLLNAGVTGAPEIENKRFLVVKYLLLRRMAPTAALVVQSGTPSV